MCIIAIMSFLTSSMAIRVRSVLANFAIEVGNSECPHLLRGGKTQLVECRSGAELVDSKSPGIYTLAVSALRLWNLGQSIGWDRRSFVH
jgi:hypothetical protein